MVVINKKIILASGIATAIGIGSCQKYEDGPAFSLLSKKQRLTGEWEVTKWRSNGGYNMISQGVDIEMEFDSDGDFKLKMRNDLYNNYGSGSSSWDIYNGEWEFSHDKEEIEIDWDNNYGYGYDGEIEITRLTNKELEGEFNVGGGVYDIEFEAEKD